MTFLNGNGEIIGKITGNGTNGVSYATSGSDVAEYFQKADASEVMNAGDAVCLVASGGVSKCTTLEQNVIGVISDRAGFVGGVNHAGDNGYVLVGLMGQLPVHIASDSASIVAGDSLTISGTSGALTKASGKGAVVARSLQVFDPATSSDNTIMAYVSYASAGVDNFAVQTNYATDASLMKKLAELEVDKLTVNNELMVLGKTTVTDLGVTGDITAGILAIHGSEGTINALGTLKLQSNGYGNIDLFAGKVNIDNKGNITTQGVLGAKKIEIDESDPESSSIGSVVLKAGNLTVTVTTSALTSNSHIFATPDHPVLYGVKKIGANTFTVSLEQKQTSDTHFDWWIVN